MIALALLCLFGLKVGIKEPVDDYISPKGTLAVKGLFVLIVFLSHSEGYVTYSAGLSDMLMLKTCSAVNQLMVVPFFFYSGYGIMLSSMTKKDYGKKLPKNRLLPLYLKFVFAVIIYLIAGVITGVSFNVREIIGGLTGWESVGNSNWFMFATFVLYIISFISLVLFKNKKLSALTATLLTFVYIAAVILAGKEVVWYDTVLTFPLGMWFAIGKEEFEKLTDKFSAWFVSLLICGGAFLAFWYMFKITEGTPVSIAALIFKSLFFALCLVTVTRRFSPRNKILSFFGKHVFGIYIFQRLPMLLLSHFVPNINSYIFAAVSFILTVGIAVCFERFIRPEKLLNQKGDKV